LRIISLEHSFVHLCDCQKLEYLGRWSSMVINGHQYIGILYDIIYVQQIHTSNLLQIPILNTGVALGFRL
jgi:hypothetical protein